MRDEAPGRAKGSRATVPKADEQLCFALYSAGHAFTRLYRSVLADLGLTYPQYLVMLVLWEGDGIGVKAVGERLMLDSGTLTPLLKRLEAAGLVRRERGREDERQVLLFVTEAGWALAEAARRVPEKLSCALGDLPDSGRGLFRALQDLRGRLLDAADSADPAAKK